MANEGLGGALLLSIGGTILFSLLYNIITTSTSVNERYSILPIAILVIFSFVGFLFVGMGLSLIAESGKPKPEQKASQFLCAEKLIP
jgi:hypothetical protein